MVYDFHASTFVQSGIHVTKKNLKRENNNYSKYEANTFHCDENQRLSVIFEKKPIPFPEPACLPRERALGKISEGNTLDTNKARKHAPLPTYPTPYPHPYNNNKLIDAH